MKISTMLSYAGGFRKAAAQVAEMEKAGLDLVWVAEAYGIDSPSQMGYLAALTERVEIGSAILPIFTRTPTLLAMTAAGVDALSEGRFHLGLGSSGPQVIEGWHGVPFDAPLGRTREIVDICRTVWAREAPLEHHGRYYDMPLPEGAGTGLGKALKIIGRPVRPRIPIWVASLGHKNVAMTAEIADGWIPMLFVPEKAHEVWGESLADRAGQAGPVARPLQITVGGMVAIGEGDEVVALRDLARPTVALYVGGMGAKGRNFYNDVVRRYGYEERPRRSRTSTSREEGRGGGAGARRAARVDVPVRTRELRGRADRRVRTGRGQPPAGDPGAHGRPDGDRRDRQGQGDDRLGTAAGPRALVGDELALRTRRRCRGRAAQSSCDAICSISSAS